MAKKFDNKDFFKGDFLTTPIDNAKLLIKELDELEESFRRVAQVQKAIVTDRANDKNVEGIRKQRVAQEKLTDTQRVAQKVVTQKRNLEDKLRIATGNNAKVLAELNLQNREQVAINKRLVNENAKLVGSYTATSNRLKRLRKEYKDLAISEGVASEKATRLRLEVLKLDASLKKVDKSVGQSQRNVGNYGKSWSRLGATLKSGLGIIGITGLIFGIGRAFKDAFGRLREFDKEMRNLAGISGLTLKQLKPTESAIKSVAQTSIKTSNEVAKLATTLFALGKTQSEVNRLLKPTNDLSIALQATSDEAGELLVSTLNAFGKGADSGEHFADVIAKMRTSTSLDFERIKDSLGFVAATANVLNLTIGETGALIGVLQDNGVKASRAGRLLNSSFIKLAKEGKTLEGSLDRINKAQERGAKSSEILRIAEKDFGLQSASLGVILANNRDKVAELANEFDNLSNGSLERLTNEQLQSLDAQLKITESTWESLILSIESGDGVISNAFKNALTGINKFLVQLRRLNQSFDENLTEDLANRNKEFISNLEDQIADNISLRKKEIDEEIKLLESRKNRGIISEKSFVDEKKKLVEDFASFTEGSRKDQLLKEKANLQETIKRDVAGTSITIDNAEKEVERLDAIAKNRIDKVSSRDSNFELVEQARAEQRIALEQKGLANTVVINKDRIRLINLLLSEQEELIKTEEEEIEVLGRKKKSIRELNGLIELQTKLVSDLNTEIKRATTEDDIFDLKNKVDIAKAELDRLNRIVSSSREEFDKRSVSLIEDDIDRAIAGEKAKSEAVLAQIRSNSTTSITEKQELIAKETKRLDTFERSQELKREQTRIKNDERRSKAEFEQRRTGFETEKEFEEEKAAQFQAIKIKAIKDEIEALEELGGKDSELRIKELNAELESFEKLGKGFEDLKGPISDAIKVIGEVIDEVFEKRILAISEQLEKTSANVDRLRDKANKGQLASEESLAFEQKQEIELERQREQQRKEQERAKAFFAVLDSFNANDGDIGKTISDVAVLRSLAGTLTGFWEGTDDVGQSLGSGQLSGRDGHIVRVDGSEQVWSGKDRGAVGYRTRDEIKSIVNLHDNGFMNDMIQRDDSNEFLSTGAFVMNGMNNSAVVSELKNLNRSIQDIEIPVGTVDFDSIRGYLTMMSRKGNTVITTKSKLHS